ncbi:MAG: hypothetical protein RR410_05055 [Alistipes sp.]
MFKKFFLVTLAACTFAACSNDDNNDTTTPPVQLPDGWVFAKTNTAIGDGALTSSMRFFGTSAVRTMGSAKSDNQGVTYTDPAAQFEITTAADGKLYLYMHATRFAAAMPPVEMRLAATSTFAPNAVTMAERMVVPENFVPATSTWVANAKYTITELECKVTDTQCRVVFTCAGRFQVYYKGQLILKK